MDRGAQWAKVHGVSKSQTQLSDWALIHIDLVERCLLLALFFIFSNLLISVRTADTCPDSSFLETIYLAWSLILCSVWHQQAQSWRWSQQGLDEADTGPPDPSSLSTLCQERQSHYLCFRVFETRHHETAGVCSFLTETLDWQWPKTTRIPWAPAAMICEGNVIHRIAFC